MTDRYWPDVGKAFAVKK